MADFISTKQIIRPVMLNRTERLGDKTIIARHNT